MGQDRWISVDGVRLYVREWPGDGAPFVLLHGLASNCRTWEAVARSLSGAGHRVVTVDQRGHGLSDKPARGYGFDEVTADLDGLLSRLELSGRPVLAGQSWGGSVVMEFAARRPGVARGLVLVDGGYMELSTRPGWTWEKAAIDLKPPSLTGMPRGELAARIRRMHPDWSDEGIEATLGNFEALPDGTVRPWLSLDRHLEIVRAMWEYHVSRLYEKIAEPVLIVPAGDPNDPERMRMKESQVERAQAALPRSRVRWFPSTDHDIHVQRPDELASAMLEATRDGFFPEA